MQGWQKLGVSLLAATFAVVAWADSNVRMVRFTLVTGGVELRLPGEHQWHPALLDAPLVAGAQVRTLDSGRAEIQLEHGSTLRLIPNSEIAFPKLALSDHGDFLTTAQVVAGTAFVTLRKSDSGEFRLLLPQDAALMPDGAASLRADATAVTVLAGKARLQIGRDQLTLGKDQQAELKLPLRAASAGAADPWTRWSQTRDTFYETAFERGVEPGSSAAFVNWGVALPAAPHYSGTGLTYVGAQNCPWSVNSGDYKGWCWSTGQGWYLPVQTVAADPSAAANNAEEVDQTNSQLVAGSAPTSVMAGSFSPFFFDDFSGGCGAGFGYGCMFGNGMDSLWAVNTYIVPSGGVVATAVPPVVDPRNGRRPRMPGQRFRPAAGNQLHPPPVAPGAIARLQRSGPRAGMSSGIEPARLGMTRGNGFARAASFGGAGSSFSGRASASGLSQGTGLAPASIHGGFSASPASLGTPRGGAGGMPSARSGGSAGRVAH